MSPDQLRATAVGELENLGPEPADDAERAFWLEERRGIVVLLAGLADWDAKLLRRAAFGPPGTVTAAAAALLLDAASECR